MKSAAPQIRRVLTHFTQTYPVPNKKTANLPAVVLLFLFSKTLFFVCYIFWKHSFPNAPVYETIANFKNISPIILIFEKHYFENNQTIKTITIFFKIFSGNQNNQK